MAKCNILSSEEVNRICSVYDETRSQKETAKITKHSLTTISKYLIQNGRGCGMGGNPHYRITDEDILQGIAAGLTRQEIADLHGVHVENLAKRMKKLGVHARYSDYVVANNFPPKRFGECWHYVKSFDDKCKELCPDFQYLESRTVGSKRLVRLRCKQCGLIIEKHASSIRRGYIKCDDCKQLDEQLQNERIKLMRFFIALKQSKTPKTCACCGEKFFSEYYLTAYCSSRCKRKAKRERYKERHPGKYTEERKKYSQDKHYIARAQKYGCKYEHGITREKVVKRDGNICQICGKECNSLDKRWGDFGPDYPTLDHIIPLSKGGPHIWSNVQCACGECNSVIKGSKYTVKREEVWT